MDNLIVFAAKYLIFLLGLVVGLYWLWRSRADKLKLGLSLISALVVALVLAKLAGKFYYHARPFVTQNIKPLIPHAADNGFPSEHSIATATLATVVYFFNRQFGLGLFVGAVLVGLGRIGAHVHSPIDIITGLALGLLAGWIGHQLANQFFLRKRAGDETSAKPPEAHR